MILQAEIAQLRSDLLTAQMDAAQALISTTKDEAAIETFNKLNKELSAANENVVTTNTTLSENTNASQNTPSTNTSGGTSPSGGAANTRY